MEHFDVNIFAGNLGSGKTTAGRRLESAIGAEFIDPDYIRRELGIQEYDPADTQRVMGLAIKRLTSSVEKAQPVALCSAFVRQSTREAYYGYIQDLAERYGREISAVLVWCNCSEQEAKRRISNRGPKDELHCPPNDPAVYDRMKATERGRGEFDDPSRWANVSHLVYNTELVQVSRQLVRPGHVEAVGNLEDILLGRS